MFFENQELKWSERVTKLRFVDLAKKPPILFNQAYFAKSNSKAK
jgi:hypothetical protein